jgi:NCS1 family nucleobase:cation symporter-1
MSAPDKAGFGNAEALEAAWPAHPGERTWSGWALFGVSVSAAVATWVFIIGGFVSYYLPAGTGMIAMVAGSLVGIVLVVLAIIPVAARFGVDTVAAIRPQLGVKGSYLGLIQLYLSVVGWNILLLIFLGRAMADILISLDVIGDGTRNTFAVLAALAGAVVVWLLLRGGPEVMRRVGAVVAISVGVLSIIFLYLLIHEVGLSTIFDAKPSASTGSKVTDYTLGFETLAVSNLSWWAYAGGMIRFVPSARKALWPVVFGLGLPVSLLSFIGLFAGLAVPDSGGDPTAFLVETAGTAGAIPALLFIILANVGTTMVGVYVSAIGLKQIPALQARLSWNTTTAVALVPVAVVVIFFGNWFFDHFGTFLAFLGVAFAPLVGIGIVDYYVLRRRRVSVHALFDHSPQGAYHFWGGVNPAAIVGLVIGAVVYILLLDPVSYESHAPFQYVSATLPSAFLAAAGYWLVTKLVVIPAGKGGYAEAEPRTEPVAAAAVPEPALQVGDR